MNRFFLMLAVSWLTPVSAWASAWAWLNPEMEALDREAAALVARLDKLAPAPAPQVVEHAGFHSGFAPATETVRWVQVDLGKAWPLDAVVIVPAFFGAPGESAGPYGFPARFRVDASDDVAFTESRTLLDHTTTDFHATMAPIHIDAGGAPARYVRFTATQLEPHAGNGHRTFFCLGELMVFSNGADVAAQAKIIPARGVDTPPTWSPHNLVDGVSALGLPVVPGPMPNSGWHSKMAKAADEVKWVQVDLGESRVLQEVRIIPAHPPDFPDRPGFGFPRRFKVEADDDPAFAHPQLIFDATAEDFPNPGDNPVPLPAERMRARYVRMTATLLWERTNDYGFALGELEVYADGKNVALHAPVMPFDSVITPFWRPELLTDGIVSTGPLMDWNEWLRQLSQRRELTEQLEGVHRKQAAALTVAEHRAAAGGAGAAGVIALCFVAAVLRARRARHRELDSLRERIARDLHDEIGSHLGSITLMSELALRDASTADRDTLQDIHRLSREAAGSMRGIIWLVREPGEPTLARLVEAMKQSAAALLQNVAWEFGSPDHGGERKAALDFHRHVFLFFREAIHNVSRHAGAKQVRVEVTWDEAAFRLLITDDGRGFDPQAPVGGSGLANLRHRAQALHGSMELQSGPGEGTRVALQAPLS